MSIELKSGNITCAFESGYVYIQSNGEEAIHSEISSLDPKDQVEAIELKCMLVDMLERALKLQKKIL